MIYNGFASKIVFFVFITFFGFMMVYLLWFDGSLDGFMDHVMVCDGLYRLKYRTPRYFLLGDSEPTRSTGGAESCHGQVRWMGGSNPLISIQTDGVRK